MVRAGAVWMESDSCKICFEYGLYYSPVSTPQTFGCFPPIVFGRLKKKQGQNY